MPAYYIYLISSLPMLRFGARAPFTFSKFLQICREFIPPDDLDILSKVSISGEYETTGSPTLRAWQDFDTALRNELVKARAQRRGVDADKYLRQQGYVESSTSHIAMTAYRHPSILEAERMLDEERWRALEELAAGHYFDLDFLVVYALKLLLLQRWEKIQAQDKAGLIEGVLGKS